MVHAGIATSSADPSVPYYHFKFVNGANASKVYFGMLQIITIVHGVSIADEYRIADQYAPLSVAQ
jgi:hypothetical protein